MNNLIKKYNKIVGNLERYDDRTKKGVFDIWYNISDTFGDYDIEYELVVDLTEFLSQATFDYESWDSTWVPYGSTYVEYEKAGECYSLDKESKKNKKCINYKFLEYDDGRPVKEIYKEFTKEEIINGFIEFGVEEKDAEQLVDEIIEEVIEKAIDFLDDCIPKDSDFIERWR